MPGGRRGRGGVGAALVKGTGWNKQLGGDDGERADELNDDPINSARSHRGRARARLRSMKGCNQRGATVQRWAGSGVARCGAHQIRTTSTRVQP